MVIGPIRRRIQWTRRQFLRRAFQVTVGAASLAGATSAYGFWEASQIQINRKTIALAHLPPAFAGKTIAVLADLHHGPLVGIRFIREAVKLANSLRPDAFALVGDFAHSETYTQEQLPPCLEALSRLEAPLGLFAVPGNHDMQFEGIVYREVIKTTRLTDLTNRSICLTSSGKHLWITGVDDLAWGNPDVDAALSDIPENAAVVLLSHNPDLAEEQPDERVGLILSGHTHGGQIYLPGMGTTWLPSKYGEKYRSGLVQGPASQVFVSRGLGESGIPLRLNCPPEINLLTLIPTT
ncbi:MAG TPA: metallophosphoesterase [Gemmataceae bacterium]|nr:metallophosphoesterase [Gemmataceae bacterium]